MKDNIESKHICNRKFIIELRYDHKPIVADKKGAIIEGIKDLKLFPTLHWEMGAANVLLYDDTNKDECRNSIRVDLDRFAYISSKIDTVDSFYNNFEKIYNVIVKTIGEFNIRRIGCRILGTYKCNSTDFTSVMSNMRKDFPAKFYLETYPVKDLMFQVTYQNGMYNVGPVREGDDAFIENNFPSESRIRHVGVAIDTDNYLTNETQSINESRLIKDIYMLSLSVEKDLYTNLKSY